MSCCVTTQNGRCPVTKNLNIMSSAAMNNNTRTNHYTTSPPTNGSSSRATDDNDYNPSPCPSSPDELDLLGGG